MFQLTWGLILFYLLTIIQGAIRNAATGGAKNFKPGIKNAQEFTTPLSVVTESKKLVNQGLLNKEAAQLKNQAKCTLATSKLLSVMSSKPQQTETATKAPNWRDLINSWKCSKQEKVQKTRRWTITDYILLILLTVSVLLSMYGYYLDEIYYWQLWERNILKERSSFKKKNRSPSETETASSSDMEGF